MTASKSRSFLEITSVLGFIVAAKFLLADIYLGFFTPGSIAIFGSLVLIWIFQMKNGEGLKGLGLKKPESWKRFGLTAILTFVMVLGVALLIIPMLLQYFKNTNVNLNPLGFPLILIWLRIMFSAAFGEEIVFRGFLLPRFETFFSSFKFAAASAVILQAVIFGLVHYSSGVITVISAGLIGLVFGIGFILGKRNLWPLILVHAIPDTISLLQG